MTVSARAVALDGVTSPVVALALASLGWLTVEVVPEPVAPTVPWVHRGHPPTIPISYRVAVSSAVVDVRFARVPVSTAVVAGVTGPPPSVSRSTVTVATGDPVPTRRPRWRG